MNRLLFRRLATACVLLAVCFNWLPGLVSTAKASATGIPELDREVPPTEAALFGLG